MRVFVTGATGFIGSAVANELRRRDHDMVGLTRNESSADTLRDAGVDVHRGDNDRAELHFGWLAMFAAIDNPISNDWTPEATGGAPRGEELIETMQNAGYFDRPSH